jgi:phage terminase large subunit-like protein
VEKTDDAVQYEKVQPEHRIDLFDASVFACVAMEQGEEKQNKLSNFFG